VRIGRIVVALAAATLAASPARAQSGTSLRPFFLVSEQRFAAADTFNAVFGSSSGTFLGGGGQVTFGRFFFEVSASRYKKDGERAFVFEGQTFQLGIPLTVTVTPVEFTGGYRMALTPWLLPYGGGGFGIYRYHETSEFADPNENVDERHSGYVLLGGLEFRVHRWVGLSVDGQYTHVGGILGQSGLSQDLGEDNLGGVAARFRVLIGH
jgi:opacity protein-like surface antigen